MRTVANPRSIKPGPNVYAQHGTYYLEIMLKNTDNAQYRIRRMHNDHELVALTITVISAVFACVVSYNMGSNSAKTQILAKCIQIHEDKPVVEVKQICTALIED